MSSSTREQMEFPSLVVMMFRDRILTFQQLEGERICETWARFKSFLLRCPTHEIPDIVLLDCFYKSLGLGNKTLADRLIPGGITHQPYAIAAHMFDHMAEANQEVEKDFMLAALLTQMDELAKKIVEIEVQCKKKDMYVPPHERRKPKENEGKRVEGMLSIILNKRRKFLANRRPCRRIVDHVGDPDGDRRSDSHDTWKSCKLWRAFGEKYDVTELIRRPAERLMVRPLSAPLYFLCTALGEPPKQILSKSVAVESSEEALGTIIKLQADTSRADAQTDGTTV
uniref:Integrase core domain containing protein n=1 Tax=Solanum tuberosum TaxID=4113 RepID=M1E074_SOLTU